MRSLATSLGGVALLVIVAVVMGAVDPGGRRDVTLGYFLAGLLGLIVLAAILWALLGVHQSHRATVGRIGSGRAMIGAAVAFANGALSVLVPLWAIFVFIGALVLLVPLGIVAVGCTVAALIGLRGERMDDATLARLTVWTGWIVAIVAMPVAGGWAMLSSI